MSYKLSILNIFSHFKDLNPIRKSCHTTATICQQPQRIATRGTPFATYSLGTLLLFRLTMDQIHVMLSETKHLAKLVAESTARFFLSLE